MNTTFIRQLISSDLSQLFDGFGFYRLSISMIFIMILSYQYFLKPNFLEYKNLLSQEKSLKIIFEKKQVKAGYIEAYRKQLVNLEREWEMMFKELLTENEISVFLDLISQAGLRAGLNIERLRPLAEQINDFYIELPITIMVSGEYQQLTLFLSYLAEFSPKITLHDFEIGKSVSEKEGGNKESLLNMQIIAKIYRYQR